MRIIETNKKLVQLQQSSEELKKFRLNITAESIRKEFDRIVCNIEKDVNLLRQGIRQLTRQI